MGKKRTAEDYYQVAEINGWVKGAYEKKNRMVLK
jgi:hypothetical protein